MSGAVYPANPCLKQGVPEPNPIGQSIPHYSERESALMTNGQYLIGMEIPCCLLNPA